MLPSPSSRTSPPMEPSTLPDQSVPTRLSTSQSFTRPGPTPSRPCPRLLLPQSMLSNRSQLLLTLLPQLLMLLMPLPLLLMLDMLDTLVTQLPLDMLDMLVSVMLVSVLPDTDMPFKW